MRYFTAVAEELNFRRAAERLHITAPSLSTQIRDLEEELGARLLERDTHRVALTPAGSAFLDSCRQILRNAEDTVRMVGRIAKGHSGRLSVGFVPSLAHGLLPRILRAFHGAMPQAQLQLTQMDTAGQIKALADRELDLGFIGLGLPTETAELELRMVCEEALMAVLPQAHPLACKLVQKRRSVPLNALARERFFLAERESAPLFNPWLIVLCQRAGFQPHVVQESGQPITVLNYVAAGLGVTILPAQFSRLAMEGVSFIPLANPAPRYRYFAAWSPRNQDPVLMHFVETAVHEGKGRCVNPLRTGTQGALPTGEPRA